MYLTQQRKLPRQARSQALVEAILDATARILVEQGRSAANTNAIAARAGVSIGSLYQYFPNREAIIAALAHRHGARVHERVANALADTPPATLDDAIERIVAAVFAAHRIDPALHHALDHDLHRHRHDHAIGTKAALATLLLGLPPGLWPGVVCPEAERAARVASEIVHALAHLALAAPDPALEAEAVRAALAYLRETAR